MTTIITTRHLSVLLHLKVWMDQVKAMEQSTFTQREREVVQESLQRAYEWAEFLLPPDLQEAYRSREKRGGGGHSDATQ